MTYDQNEGIMNIKMISGVNGMEGKGKCAYVFPPAVTGEDIRVFRRRLSMTQSALAKLLDVSVKTVERWEAGKELIHGPVIALMHLLREMPEALERFEVPEKRYPLRMWYMYRREACTVIDVDEQNRKVWIRNFTDRVQYRAFGKTERPTFEMYERFLEERCFPPTRDKMKLILKELDLPFYDPMMIIRKTEGRMAEDEFWLKLEDNGNDSIA